MRKNSLVVVFALLGAMMMNVGDVMAIAVEENPTTDTMQLALDNGMLHPEVAFVLGFKDPSCALTPGVCPGNRFLNATAVLVKNDEQQVEAGIVLSAHQLYRRDGTGLMWSVFSFAFRENGIDANNNGDVIIVIPTVGENLFIHPSADVAAFKIPVVVRDDNGGWIPPAELASLAPITNSHLKIVGTGRYCSLEDAYYTESLPVDGRKRAGWGVYDNELGVLEVGSFTPPQYTGLGQQYDSGAGIYVSENGRDRLAGIMFKINGFAEFTNNEIVSFTNNDGEIRTWLEGIMGLPSNSPTPTPTATPSPTPSPSPSATPSPTPSPTPTPTPTQTPNAVPGDVWSLYANNGAGGYGSDGEITEGDWTAIKEHILGNPIPPSLMIKADADGNGVIDISDMYTAMLMMQGGG